MAKNFIFVNPDGNYQEGEQAYEQSDFIDTSAGAGDAGKPVKLNGSGLIDGSMLNITSDHGGLTGLADDDHTQYLLVDGTRAMSGAIDMGSNLINNVSDGLVASDAVNKGQLDTAIDGVTSTINSFEWQESVIDKDLTSPPGSPVTGDRYLLGLAGAGRDNLVLSGMTTSAYDGTYTFVGYGMYDAFTYNTNSDNSYAMYSQPDGGGGYHMVIYDTNNLEYHVGQTGTDPATLTGPSGTSSGTPTGISSIEVIGDGSTESDPQGTFESRPSSSNAEVSYSSGSSMTGAWLNQDGKIAEYNGASWDFLSPTTGTFVAADDESDKLYLYSGSSWEAKYFEATTASTGLTKVGFDIQIDPASAGDGLSFAAGQYDVNVDDSSIEISADALQVKAAGITNAMLAGSIADGKLAQDYIQTSEVDDSSIEFNGGSLNIKALGIKDTMIDFGIGAGQVSAVDIPVEDANAYFTATDQEGVNNELFVMADAASAETAVADGTGVTAGDLIYFSAADTVSTMPINALHRCVGIALNTAGPAGQVQYARADIKAAGVVSGATAGIRYYWDGASLSSTIPATAGAYVWAVGVARNATDLQVDVEYIKQNAN